MATKNKILKLPWIDPMLATLTHAPFSDDEWIFEPKFDGVRCLAYCKNDQVLLYSRNQLPLNLYYPEIAQALKKQPCKEFIIDGEIVALNDKGLPSFSVLQQRMKTANPSLAIQKQIPLFYYVFDLLYLDGKRLTHLSLLARKKQLQTHFKFKDPIRFTSHLKKEGERYFKEACKLNWEGLVAKKADSPYICGRSKLWQKFKCLQRQEFVIGGYTDSSNQDYPFGALLLGYYQRGKLHYAGKVGTGFNAKTAQDVKIKLQRLEITQPAFVDFNLASKGVHWVQPKLVSDIAFTEWTLDAKLRHAVFLGLRIDKVPTKIVREK